MSNGKSAGQRIALAGILLLATMGVILAGLLTLREHDETILGGVCGPTGGCERVLTSSYARVLGIPVAAFGVGYYAAMIVFWSVLNLLQPGKIRRWIFRLTAFLATGAVLISAVLVIVQLHWIHAICPLCITSACDCAVIFIFLTYLWRHADFDAEPLAGVAGLIMLAAMAMGAWLIIWPAEQHIVGRVGSDVVSADAMNAALGPDYRTLQWQSYRIQHDWVEAQLGTIVLGMEAKTLGLTTAELVRQKVDQAVNDKIDDYMISHGIQGGMQSTARDREQTFARLDPPARSKYIHDLMTKYGAADYLPLPPIAEDDLANIPGWHRGADAIKAKARLVIFADFTCEYCAELAPKISSLMSEYGGQVSCTFHYLPHPLHEHSMESAIAAECAGEQGKFWEYHDALMQHHGKLDGVDFLSVAAQLGLDTGRFMQCQSSAAAGNAVQKSLDQATAMGLGTTPVVFLNGKRIGGVVEEKDLSRQIKVLLIN